MKCFLAYIGVLVSLVIPLQAAQAGVVVGGTRIIYDGTRKEAGLTVSNPDKSTPYLMQSWIENFSERSKEKVPFLVTPPLFRLDAQQENVLRIVRVGGSLPEDRESVFWMNIKSIPASQKNDANELQVTVRAQIKLFYRPAALKGENADESYKELTFTRKDGELLVSNPTSFHVSFYSLKVGGVVIDQPGMVAPHGVQRWKLPASAGRLVTWQAINDFGGITPVAEAPL